MKKVIIAIAILSLAISQYYNQTYNIGGEITLDPYYSLEEEIYHTEGVGFVLFFKYSQIIIEKPVVNPINAKVFDSQGKIVYQIKAEDSTEVCVALEPPFGSQSNCITTVSASLHSLPSGNYKLKLTSSQNTTIPILYEFGDYKVSASVSP